MLYCAVLVDVTGHAKGGKRTYFFGGCDGAAEHENRQAALIKLANAADQVTSLSADISLGSELESSKAELSETAALPEKTFYFSDFPRQVYCTLSGIRLRLVQTGEGRGIAYFTFTQTCNSRRSDVATGLDWVFNSTLYEGQNVKIRDI